MDILNLIINYFNLKKFILVIHLNIIYFYTNNNLIFN